MLAQDATFSSTDVLQSTVAAFLNEGLAIQDAQ